jgi:2-hydroxychromene-2-carboxylate isomerase
VSTKKRVPRFYFSLRSPYSWLAYRDLMERYADVARQVEWVPFFEPDETSERLLVARGGNFPYSQMSRAKHLYVLQDVKRLAAARGLSPAWPVDRQPVWEVPHLGYLVACDGDAGPEYIARVYQARWEEGRDICDPAAIAEIGASLGLDYDVLAAVGTDAELRNRGVDVLLEICRDRVFGVPFFVDGMSHFWGLDRLPDFARLLRVQRRSSVAEPVLLAADGGSRRSSDEGHAGGCG